MIAVSDTWVSHIGQPLPHLSKVVVRDGETGEVTPVPVSEGSVALDDSAAVRGTCTFTVPGADYMPAAATDLLAPIDNEVQPYRGVRYPDGTEEYVSLGVFGIQEVSLDLQQQITEVTAYDRSQRMSNAKFEDVYQITSGTAIGDAIVAMAQQAWPDVPYDADAFDAITTTMPTVTAHEGDDRWEYMQGFATALGYVLYFDNEGVLTARPYTVSDPVFTVQDGENGTLLSGSREWSKTDSFNRVIATGENTKNDDVYRAVATDDNPQSPTRYTGPFGKVPKFFDSTYIQSNNQAEDAANAILAQELGTLASISFEMAPNPALEPGDCVRVVRTTPAIDERHVIDTMDIGLGADTSMGCATRQVIV